MARRPRTDDDDVSLFPFLSIIACVIGVLTMMIATLALGTDGHSGCCLDRASLSRTKKELEPRPKNASKTCAAKLERVQLQTALEIRGPEGDMLDDDRSAKNRSRLLKELETGRAGAWRNKKQVRNRHP